MGELDDRTDERTSFPLVWRAPHETAVDFQGVYREAAQVLQGRITGAKIVDSQRKTGIAKLREQLASLCCVMHQGVLGEFQFQQPVRHLGLSRRVGNHGNHCLIQEFMR